LLILCTHTITNTPVPPSGVRVARFPPGLRPSPFHTAWAVTLPFSRLAQCSFSLWSTCSLIRPRPNLLHRRLRVPPLPAIHAPIASGWSNSCRVGYLPPTGSTRPFHGARKKRAKPMGYHLPTGRSAAGGGAVCSRAIRI